MAKIQKNNMKEKTFAKCIIFDHMVNDLGLVADIMSMSWTIHWVHLPHYFIEIQLEYFCCLVNFARPMKRCLGLRTSDLPSYAF